MKKILFLIFMALFPLAVPAQEVPVSLNVDLEMGQAIELEKSSIKFLKVTSDSRCPKQVSCIWPGEAKVLLGITVMGKYVEKEVVVSGTGGEFTIAEDLQVLVSHLRPYPETAIPIAPSEYYLRIAAAGEKGN